MRALVLAAAVLFVLALPASGVSFAPLSVPRELNVVSYYPADAGWTEMWDKWEPARIAADFDRAASVHANTVRAIVQPTTFGYPHPSRLYADRLAQFVSLAGDRGLHVQLTLFDWWYSWFDKRGSQMWLRELLAPYKNDPRIAFVELRNEVFPKPEVTKWAVRMIPLVHRLLPGTPVTLSVDGRNAVHQLRTLKRLLGKTQPDFYDLHYFGHGGETAYDTFRRAKAVVAPVPLWIGETGYPTTSRGSGFGGLPRSEQAQEAGQTQFLSAVAWAARANGLAAPGVWQLGDLVPAAIPDRAAKPDDPDLHYGVFRVDGSAKPAASTVRAIFEGQTPLGFNNGFEDAVDGVPAQWQMNGDGMWFAVDHSTAATGAASGELAGDGTGAYSIVPPDGGVRAGDRVSVTLLAKRAAPVGTVLVVLEWFDRSRRVIHRDSSPPLATSGVWSQIAVGGGAPRNAAYVRIDLVGKGLSSPAWFDDVVFSRQ